MLVSRDFKVTLEVWERGKEIAHDEDKSMSQLMREILGAYIAWKDPSNPQKSLESYLEGTAEHHNRLEDQLTKEMTGIAADLGNKLDWTRIREQAIRLGLKGGKLLKACEETAQYLRKCGVKVWF